MRALYYAGPRQLEFRDVPEPEWQGPGEALVAPVAVATCDLDHYIAVGATRFPGGLALGHECVARVLRVGDNVRTIKPGDLVAVPFQISCGECAPCQRGHTGNCATVGPFTTYGFGVRGTPYGGLYADVARVPFADAMLVGLPAGVTASQAASVSDNIADAYRAVAPFVTPETRVLIVGGLVSSIGLYAAGLAVALGAAQTHYLDTDLDRLERARQLGAQAIEGDTPPKGRYQLSVDASGTTAGLHTALRALDFESTCFSVVIDFANNTPMPQLDMYLMGSTYRTGRAHARPNIPPILELIATGRLRPELVTTAELTPEETPERLVAGGYTKLITRWQS
jgi:alcohol dehydrogenase